MHCRLHKYAAVLTALLLSSGCVQMTRHSNMVVFGTNTSVGVRVGTSATSVPEIQLGYSRQEAVVMPLVANTSGRAASDGRSDLLEPCDLTQAVEVTGNAPFAVHPCSLVAINGSALDSYSVLASFGARFGGSAEGGRGEAAVGLAQYFSTGMAAQMLALTGGAAVVAVSQAAENSAANRPTAALASLYANPQAFQIGVANNDAYEAFRTRLVARIAATAPAVLSDRIKAFETAVGSNQGLADDCPDLATCVEAINQNDPYRPDYRTRRAAYDAALQAWQPNP